MPRCAEKVLVGFASSAGPVNPEAKFGTPLKLVSFFCMATAWIEMFKGGLHTEYLLCFEL
jgi:hypothetical protein